MRIAQITHSYKPIIGGADVWVELLRRVCEAAGHEVVVYQRPVEGIDDPALRLVRSPLRSALGPRGEFWTVPCGLPRLRRELAACDILVVHYPIHHRFLEWHPRTVLVSHGVFWDDRPGALRSRIKRHLARRAYAKARAVVANDTFFLREVGEPVQPGVAPFSEIAPRRFFVPNCVDTEQFSRAQPLPELTAWPVILVPRNLYRNRGIHLAVEAFARCGESLDEARLVVMGREGDPGYLEECRELAGRLGVGERVIFFGPVAWEKMAAAYSAAELTLIPTLCGEGTSLSALESMSCGTATLTTDVAGLADLPAAKSAANPGALAEALVELWPRRAEVAREQQEVVRSVYNLDNWKDAWLRIIGQVAGPAGLELPSPV